VAISPETQLLVFDSAKTSGKPYGPKDPAYAKYQDQLQTVQQLALQKPQSFFLSHHPLLAVAPSRDTRQLRDGGNAGLLSAFEPLYPERLLPEGVDASMHGHLHFFEAISFKTAHPASLVMGNAGSANEASLPTSFTPGEKLHRTAIIEDYAATAAYGFATLDKISAEGHKRWLLTEYDIEGEAVFSCTLENGKSKCTKPVK
jgi:hypothetical protein